MSTILLLLALILFFLAIGISRSVFDGMKGQPTKGKKVADGATKRKIWSAWLLAGVGGIFLLLSYILER